MSSIRKAYRTILKDFFPEKLTLDLGGELTFTKRLWTIPDDEGVPQSKGLRYGDNPDQPAALYQWTGGEIKLNDAALSVQRPLVSGLSEEHFVQFGKHPGKTNLTDVDSGIAILINLPPRPAAVILKHNNPCGVAVADSVSTAYERAYYADRIAAMGGCVLINRPMDMPTAEAIASSYSEVVVAPSFEEGTVEVLRARKNLRIIRLPVLGELHAYGHEPHLHFTSLRDGGLIVELSQTPQIQSADDLTLASHKYKGALHEVKRAPSARETEDLLIAWAIASGVTSNSVVMVRGGVTTAIGTGEQDRVGAVKLAIEKAYTKFKDALVYRQFERPLFEVELAMTRGELPADTLDAINRQVAEECGGLRGSALASDGFFPFRDGVDAALEHGITAIIQPGGSIKDFESITACNERDATMVFTGQRVFRH